MMNHNEKEQDRRALKRLLIWGLVAAGVFLVVIGIRFVAYAAGALPVSVQQVHAYRDVLEDNDLLVVARYGLTPQWQEMTDTFDDVSVSVGGTAEPMLLTNRHRYTTTDSMVVTEMTGDTDITAYCDIVDQRRIECVETGLSGIYDMTITYVGGWGAYSGSDVIFRLNDQGGDLVTQRYTPDLATEYGLVGLYIAAGHSVVWEDNAVEVRLLASPSAWASPATATLTGADFTWCLTCATLAQTETALETGFRSGLNHLENIDTSVADGQYVNDRGITLAGRDLAIAAWNPIVRVIPEAFLDSSYNPMVGFTPGPSSMTDADEAARDALLVSDAFDGLGQQLFGLTAAEGHVTAALFVLVGGLILAVVVGWITQKYGDGQPALPLAILVLWLTLLAGWFIGPVPMAWWAIPAGMLGAWGLIALFARRVFA